MAISRSKFPANVENPSLRVTDPRWPDGPKPGTIVWGEADGKTTNMLHFAVPKKDPELRVTAGQSRQPTFLGLFDIGRRRHGEATVVNPVNMGITSRLTDLYEAVRNLDTEKADHEARLRGPDYVAKPGELAIRMFGEQMYHVYPAATSSEDAQRVFDAARTTWLATAVGE